MFALIAQGKLRPHVSARYPLPQGAQAIADLLARKVTGKVVITNGDDAGVESPARPAIRAEPRDEGTAQHVPAGPLPPAELARLAGQDIGVSRWYTLDQARIDAFAECTEDRQWIHVDLERAGRESPFGGTVAHGFLTLSMIPATSYDLLAARVQASQVVNYGLDRVRFVAPVRAGQRVRNRIRVLGVEERGPGRHLLTTENTIEVEGEQKPALVAVLLAMLM